MKSEGMKKVMTEKRKLGIAAFCLPVLLVVVIMTGMGVYPFGDNSLLIWDMDWQYSSFFAHLHDILHGDASLWYSFSRAIGGDMLGVAAYYLMSPFNLLFYFFDAENIYIGITLVLLLKIGFAGWAMCRYFYTKRQAADILIYSTAYALSSYVAAYFFNIMWLDGIILLPLMLLGLEQLVEKKKYILYTSTIALGVITNFYIGYMLCIFSVIYFVCYFFLISEQKKSIKTILLYAAASLLGGALSACMALPTLYAMQDGKSKIDLMVLKDFSMVFDLRKLPSEMFLGMINDTPITTSEPLVYCGVLSVILMCCFVFIKEISWKKKTAYLIMLAALAISLGYYNLCSAWQAFSLPNGSGYRFSFLYIFVVLLMAQEAYANLEKRKLKAHGRGSFLPPAVGAAVLIIFLIVGRELLQEEKGWLFAANIIFIIVYVLAMFFVRNHRCCTGVLLVMMSAELCINAAALYHYSSSYENTKISDYKEYIQKVKPFAEELKDSDELYRTVLTGDAYRTVNDSMLWNLYGLDSYTSLERDSTQRIAFQLGYYRNMIFGIHYKDGSTRAAEALLGVKYMVASKAPDAGYTLLKEEGNLGLYENQNVLPMAVMADEALFEVNNDVYDTFAYQNQIYEALCGEIGKDIFKPAELRQTKLYNCEKTAEGGFETIDNASEGCVEYQLHVEKEGNYYLQHIRAGVSGVTAIINGEAMKLQEQENVVKQLGYLHPDDDVKIRCFISGAGPRYLDEVLVYYEDMEVLAAYAKQINNGQVTVTHENEDKVMILCDNKEKQKRYLLVTIPYDEGWTVTVDGVETTPDIAMENLMVIEVETGEHEIELSFFPRGLKAGIMITGVAGLVWIVGYMAIGLRKKKKYGEKENQF